MRRKLAIFILGIATVLSLTACGSGEVNNETVTEVVAVSENITVEEETKEESVSEPEKVKVSNFYSYVNEDVLSEYELEDNAYVSSTNAKYINTVSKKLFEDLSNKSAADFDTTEPMYKMMSFYEQILDEAGSEKSMARIKEITDHIEAAKSIDDIYKLMLDEDYSLFNYMMKIDYEFMDNDDYCPEFHPKALYPVTTTTEEFEKIVADGFTKMFLDLGYDEADAVRMGTNASGVNAKIMNFYNHMEDISYKTYNEETWAEDNVKSPFLDIIQKFDYGLHDRFGKTHYYSYNRIEFISFVDELLVKDNLQEIKDYYAACALSEVYSFGTYQLRIDKGNITQEVFGVAPNAVEILDDEERAIDCFEIMLYYDNGTLANYYKEHFISDEKMKLASEVFDEVKQEMAQTVKEVDWASIKIKEQLGFKMKNMKLLVGAYDEWNQLEDMEICDNVVDTFLSLKKSERNFNHRYQVEEPTIVPTEASVFDFNMIYYRYSNTFIIYPAVLEMEIFNEEYCYEEMLGKFAWLISHEMSHSLDYNSVHLRADGKNGNFMDDTAWEAYNEMYMQIYNFIDGKESFYGNTISGNSKTNELFSDLMAMKISLRLLEKNENADFDLFFKSFASTMAENYIATYEKLMLDEDTHIPFKDRANYVLANCEKFYDTYEVDESSMYFVPKEDRVEVYK